MQSFIEEIRRKFREMIPLYLGSTHSKQADKIKPSDNTPVGNIDIHTRDVLTEIILDHFPDDTVIAEEDHKSEEEMARILADQTHRQWTVDGLDGTGNRSMHLLSYGAMISLRQGPGIMFAAIFRPADEELFGSGFYYAEAGRGAYMWCKECNKYHELRSARDGELERMMILLEGSSKKFFDSAPAKIGRKFTTRASVSSALAATTFALGRASAIMTIGNKPWDNWPIWLFAQETARGNSGVVMKWDGSICSPDDCGDMIAVAINLQWGRSVTITATFSRKQGQENILALMTKHPDVNLKVVWCLPENDTREEIERRLRRPFGEDYLGAVNSWERYCEVKNRYQPIELPHLQVNTSPPNTPEQSAHTVLTYIVT